MTAFGSALVALLILFLVAGAVPIQDSAQLAVFRTPVFLGLWILLCGLLLAVCVRRRVRGPAARVAFWFAHAGVVVVLVGALLGRLYGERGNVILPVGDWHSTGHLRSERTQQMVPIGFTLSVIDFDVTFYDTKEPSEEGKKTPKDYRAVLRFDAGNGAQEKTLQVNRPVVIGRWRLYLQSYEEMQGHVVVRLMMRHDPGRPVVVAGIWMIIMGTAVLCWRRTGGGRTP